MAVLLSPAVGAAAQFFDNNGVPLSGGLLYSYSAGTTTPATTYTDNTGGIANSNPIVLDAAGRVPSEIWLTAGSSYKLALYTSASVLIATWDNLQAGQSITGGSTGGVAYQSGTGTIGMSAAGTSGQVLTSAGAASPTWTAQSALSVGTATTATNLASGSLGTIPYQSGAGATAMLAVGTSGQSLLSNGAAAPSWGFPGASMGAPQSIVMAPTTSGASTFLPATSGTLSITSQNVTSSAPLMVLGCVSGLNGTSVNVTRMGLSTANLTWSSLAASNTSYLYVDIAANGTLTTGSTTLAPIYTQTTAPSTTSGQNTFVIPVMQMYAGNGSTAALVCRVFVGEVVTSGSGVTSSVAYNPGTTYQSSQTSTLPSSGTTVSTSHNLGIQPRGAQVYAVCLTGEGGYSAGDTIVPVGSAGANNYQPLNYLFTSKIVSWVTYGNAAPTWNAQNKTTGSLFTMTAANWAYYTVIQRGW